MPREVRASRTPPAPLALGPAGQPIVTSASSRLCGLLAYLEQVETLQQPSLLSVPAEPFRAFEAQVGDLPGLTFNQLHDGDDVWLSLPRLGPIPPPEPPASLDPWIELNHAADAEPTLRTEVLKSAKTGDTRLTLANFPGISKVFETYLEQQWKPWAAAERPRREAIALYNRLFALRQLLLTGASDAPLELVWGMGVALWKPAGARHALRYPLIAQTCDISLNAQTFEIEIRPRDAEPTLELEGLTALKSPATASLATRFAEHLAGIARRPSPFEIPTTAPFLKGAQELLDPTGRFVGGEGAGRLPDPGKQLLVTDTWVVFVRRRSVRNVLRDMTELRSLLEARPVPPAAAAQLVGARTQAKSADSSAPEPTPEGPTSDEQPVLFPLPYNEAQAAVVGALAEHAAVVVDGAPGTGKTHTIANVIAHSLAHGRRVLVTANDESTLAGLRHLLPEDLRPLTLAVVSSDRSTAKQLLQAAQAFASRAGSAKVRALEAAVAANDKRRTELRFSIDAADERIAELAAGQLSPFTIDGRDVTPGELAGLVLEGASAYGWLADPLDPESQSTPPFGNTEIAAVREARASLGADLAYLGAHLPTPETLPDEAALVALHHDLLRAHRTEALNASGTVMPLIDGSPQTLERAAKLRDLLDKADALHAAVDKDPFGWADRLRVRFQAREDPLARGLITIARSVAVEDLAQRVRMTKPVELPRDAEQLSEVAEAVERLADGKFGFRTPLGNKEARASLNAITVGGAKPATAADWRRVADELAHRGKARKLLASWNEVVGDCNLEPMRETGARASAPMAARADHVLKMHELVTRVEAPIRTEIPAVFAGDSLANLSEHDGSMRRAAAESLASHLDRGQLASASSRAREVLVRLEGMSGAIVDRLWAFLTTTIGRHGGSAGDEALTAEWRALVAELRRLEELKPILATVESIAARIEAAGATRWAGSLREAPVVGHNDPWTPADWLDAWQWRIAAMRLGSLEGHDALKQLVQRRAAARGEQARLTRTLITDRAWLCVLKTSSAVLRRALHDYARATRSMQGAASARDRQLRTDAAGALKRAAGVLPCLIVPEWRLPELLPAAIEAFDLVVIDEASRSDLSALPALLRGKELLVLGDARQSPPPPTTVAKQKLQDLARRSLADQPHGADMAPGRSLYDLALAAFDGPALALREQFRIDPAIIEFSNREFYDGSIVSLRAADAADRLEPPLVDVFVAGAERKGEVNDAEAHAIARHIEELLTDETLSGRSIGVVSLLGPDQAQRLEELIRARISPRDLVGRRIVVGMPARFQGRGRSIMLLSMAITRESAAVGEAAGVAQLFNVAVTSARDRVVLFRSIEEADAPADSCHARLIRHFREPFPTAAPEATPSRERCRTHLERAIFDALVERNYRVTPQFSAGRYRIDLVVEGAGGRRLAVECDGDGGREQTAWATSVSKQRALELAGWTFWRSFAASFVLRREHVLEDLFGTLDQMGIDPQGTAAAEPCQLSTHFVIGRPRSPPAPAAIPEPSVVEPQSEPALLAPPTRAPRRSRTQR